MRLPLALLVSFLLFGVPCAKAADAQRIGKVSAIGCERILLAKDRSRWDEPLVEVGRVVQLTPVEEASLREKLWRLRDATLNVEDELRYSTVYFEGDRRGSREKAPIRAPYNRLTAAEAQALGDYTGLSYATINHALRRITTSGALEFRELADVAAVHLMLSGLAKLPDYVGVVSRGASMSAENFAALEEVYQPGAVIREPAFLSTSPGERVHPRFRDRGKAYLTIYSKHGKEITALSYNNTAGRRYPGETEVLFAPNSRFVVEAFRWGTETIKDTERRRAYITLRELD